MHEGEREKVCDAAARIEDRLTIARVHEADNEIDHRERGQELPGFVTFEGVGEVVEDKLVEVALGGQDERVVLKSLGNRDDRPHVVWVTPVDDAGCKDFLVFTRRLIAQCVDSFNEAFDRRVG
ncbi:MAG: hypothetical protein ABMA26_10485 [Limisphaerales bacterium]